QCKIEKCRKRVWAALRIAEALAPDHDHVLRGRQQRGRVAQVLNVELRQLREALERMLGEEPREPGLALETLAAVRAVSTAFACFGAVVRRRPGCRVLDRLTFRFRSEAV